MASNFPGGPGDDTYYVSDSADTITEANGAGYDTVISTVDYTLPINVEKLILDGSANLSGVGNRQSNTIIGNAGNNILKTGNVTGAPGPQSVDTLIGGGGNDSYYIDNINDIVVEDAFGGTDTIYASNPYNISSGEEHPAQVFIMPANVENMVLITIDYRIGAGAIGNALNNVITGSAGSDVLDGGPGADTLIGGGAEGSLGSDRYYIDDVGDTIVGFGARDIVHSTVGFVLPTGSAFLLQDIAGQIILEGGANINATGNEQNNLLKGNSGNNVLDGKAGSDTMIGGLGDDVYYVGNIYDVVGERPGEGVDTVHATISYTLNNDVENLILDGSANINGTGNALYNTITGNAGDNVLSGGSGVDTITGGAGADIFLMTAPPDASGSNLANLVDFSPADDTIQLSRSVFRALALGALDPTAFVSAVSGAVAQDSNDYILYNSQTGAIFYDPDGLGGVDKIRFAQVSPGTILTSADFFVI